MLTCPKCKAVYPDGRNFCKRCGVPLRLKAARDPRTAAAKEMCAAKLAQDPFNVGLLLEYGRLLWEEGAAADAAKELEKVLSIDNSNPEALDLLASVYLGLGKAGVAEEYLQRLIGLPSRTGEHYARLAHIQSEQLNQPQRATQTLMDGLAHFPDDLGILLSRFNLLKDRGEHKELIAVGEHILRLDPGFLDTLGVMADAALAMGDKEKAYRLFEELKGVCPGDGRATLFLALRDLERASPDDTDLLTSVHASLKALQVEKVKPPLDEEELDLYEFCLALCGIEIGQTDDKSRRRLLDYLQEGKIVPANWQEIISRGFSAVVREEFDRYAAVTLLPEIGAASRGEVAPVAKEVFARLEYETAGVFEKRGNLRQARQHYGAAANLASDKGEYGDRLRDVSARIRATRRKTVLTVSIVAGVVLCLALVSYLARGRLKVTVIPPANVTVKRGEKTVGLFYDAGEVLTVFLRAGHYRVRAEAAGYQATEKPMSVGFGRRTRTDSLSLVPIYGGLVVATDPPGARVFVDGEQVGVTPFRSSTMLAKTAALTLEKPGYNTYGRTVSIQKDETTDLGLVSLEMTYEQRTELERQEASAREAADAKQREEREAQMRAERQAAEAAQRERQAKMIAERQAFERRSAPFRQRVLARRGSLVDAVTVVTDKQPSSGVYGTVRGVSNVLTLHPLRKEPGYVELPYTVPAGGATLVAQFCSSRADCGEDGSDYAARIVVVSSSGRHVLLQRTVAYSQGWVEQHFPLQEFAGQSVTLRFETVATGWCSEWTGLAAFYVVE